MCPRPVRQRDLCGATPGLQRNHVPARLAGLHDALRARVAAHADATLAELRRWLSQTHGTAASDGLMHNTLARLGLTLKKSHCTRPSRSAPTSPPRLPSGASASPG